ncbi:MAG: glycosyltransferase [Desulfonatronovibrionaceae bacterium]
MSVKLYSDKIRAQRPYTCKQPNMNILTINLSLAKNLREMGHNLLQCDPPPGAVLDAAALCRKSGFNPDCMIQQETLGKRVLVLNMDPVPCPSVYWSIDTHLNTYWQRYYGLNFDLFLSTQKKWAFELLRQGIKNTAWLPWYGSEQKWLPWEKRKHDISFVGRITEARLARKWMAEFLRDNFVPHIVQDIPFKAMLQTYANTRLVPNEAIFGEVNFRTFEAASCGAMVLSQKLEDGLDSLFDPGREIITYENVVELKGLVEYYLAHPKQAKTIAAAGRERVQKEHLPQHRAHTLSGLVQDLCRERRLKPDIYAWVSSLWLQENSLTGEKRECSRALNSLSVTPETLLFRIQNASRRNGDVLHYLVPILKQGQFDFHLLFNTGCSFAALQAGQFKLAKAFLLRHLRDRKPYMPDLADQGGLVRAWVRELVRAGEKLRPGFFYRPELHLPQSAVECLIWWHDKHPGNRSLLADIKNLLGDIPGCEPVVLEALSRLSLHRQKDWRYNLELARINLKAFRLRQGLEELVLAKKNAAESGAEHCLRSCLRRMDKNGLLRTALDEVTHA